MAKKKTARKAKDATTKQNAAAKQKRGRASFAQKITNARRRARADVRLNAVKAFAAIAEKGNALDVTVFTARLKDSDWRVRQAALFGLPDIVAQPNVEVVRAVTDCLKKDLQPDVRQAAALALIRTVEKGHPEAFEALNTRSLEDESLYVRRDAAEAAALIVDKNKVEAGRLIRERLEFLNKAVRTIRERNEFLKAWNALPRFLNS